MACISYPDFALVYRLAFFHRVTVERFGCV